MIRDENMEDSKQIFFQEAKELLEEMEESLLCLESEPNEMEYLNSVFRAMHTIKGSGGIFGFTCIVEFTHTVETELDKIRSFKRQLTAPLIALLLECKDHTSELVRFVFEQQTEELPEALQLKGAKLLTLLVNDPKSMVKTESPSRLQTEPRPPETSQENWLISLSFGLDTFRNGLDPISFIRYLSNLGLIVDMITLLNDELPVSEMDPESCYLSFRIAFQSEASKQAIAEVFEFAQDDCEIRILPPQSVQEQYVSLLQEVPEHELKHLGQMLIEVGALTTKELEHALAAQAEASDPTTRRPIGEILVEEQAINTEVIKEALKKQESIRQIKSKEAQSIRVDALKLGGLINLVGELVIANAELKTQIARYGLVDVNDTASRMEHLVEEIRDNALQLRMVPIGETFSRFRRMVRDVSSDLQKDIELVIRGGESELDKSVVEKLNDPLTHLLRNALDHGIELPAIRLAKNKTAKGSVELNAYHDSGHIVVEIKDDGAGLDPEKIRAKAVDIGLIQADQNLSRQEIFRLIFEPGLSTKQQATNLSGRGVGMDVVRRNIELLRGSIELDSEVGKGTSVLIRLPLTLAIIDGFIVGVESESYIIPLTMVEECVEFDTSKWRQESQRGYVNFRGEVLPFIRLKEFFSGVTSKGNHRESLVVVRFGRNRAALVVDRLLGEQQTVIKPLGAVFEKLSGISGATVLGSGEVALILDVQGLIEKAQKRLSITN